MSTEIYLKPNVYLLENGNDQLDATDQLFVLDDQGQVSARGSVAEIDSNVSISQTPAAAAVLIDAVQQLRNITQSGNSNLFVKIHDARRALVSQNLITAQQEAAMIQAEAAPLQEELNYIAGSLNLYLNSPGYRDSDFNVIASVGQELENVNRHPAVFADVLTQATSLQREYSAGLSWANYEVQNTDSAPLHLVNSGRLKLEMLLQHPRNLLSGLYSYLSAD